MNARAELNKALAEERTRTFLTYWHGMLPQAPEPETEYVFAPPAKYRFDLAWPAVMVAAELDGGNRKAVVVWGRNGGRAVAVGRHTQKRDYDKLNLATEMGWSVFRYLPEHLRDNPGACVRQVWNAVHLRSVSVPAKGALCENQTEGASTASMRTRRRATARSSKAI